MPIYLLTPLSSSSEEAEAVVRKAIAEEDLYELPNGAGWFIRFDGTTVELSHHLGITSPNRDQKGTLASALVTSVNSYYGRGPTPMWEWLKNRIERQS